jgi:HEAT repeat protein
MLRTYFCGAPARLAAAVEVMLARGANLDDNPVVPTLHEGSVADLRAGRGNVRGLRVGVGRRDVDLKRDVSDAWEDPKAAEVLGRKLADKDQVVRVRAVKEPADWFGPEAKAALPALIVALEHDDVATRRAAADALAIGHPLEPPSA